MTSAAYRLVHFSPDPATGVRYPIAALVSSSGGTRVEFMSHLPDARCIGGPDRVRALYRVQQRLTRVSSFSKPPSFGPYVSFDEPHDVPEENLSAFLRKLLTLYQPSPQQVGEKAPSRKSEGMKWLSAQGVDRFVRSSFQPGTGVGRFLKDVPVLEKVSHYAAGIHSLMLMEPLYARPQFEKDVKDVARRLAPYALVIPQVQGPDTQLYAYALPGLSTKCLDEAKRTLEFTHAQVINVASPVERDDFLSRIRDVAQEQLIAPSGTLRSQ